eukprot:scaffold1390_cov138-Cylindrotheca_fusiformis.AAC.13
MCGQCCCWWQWGSCKQNQSLASSLAASLFLTRICRLTGAHHSPCLLKRVVIILNHNENQPQFQSRAVTHSTKQNAALLSEYSTPLHQAQEEELGEQNS